MKWLISVFFVFAILTATNGQELTISAAFDSSKIYVGDQINFTVTIDKPKNYSLSLPVFKDTLNKYIEILKGPLIDTSIIKDGRVRIRQKYLVTSFDSGFYQLPPVYVELKNEKGVRRFYSDYAQLKVRRVNIAPADTTSKIFDIIKPYRAPITAGEVLPWVLLLLLVAAGVWFLYKYISSLSSKKSGEIPPVRMDPAHVIAFRELEKLREEKLWQKGEIKSYYTRLTEILRQYLENRYMIFSMELTTVETLAELAKSGFKENESYRKIRTVLTNADFVKFAKHNPQPSENDLHFEYSWDFVKETMMKEEVPGKSSEGNLKNEEGI